MIVTELGEEILKVSKEHPEIPFNKIAEIAERFVNWQKKQDGMSKVNYEGAKTVYDNTVRTLQEKIDEKYQRGRQDMREQMMKEAVEGEISWVDVGDDSYVKTLKISELQKAIRNYNRGDKVRVLIIKDN